jgi:uncharacterized repeat protein (TIGR03847 family)
MPRIDIELRPVTHITTDAIGPPGKRVFYIQGQQEQRTVTLIVEKVQIQSLAVGIEQFLAEIAEKYPEKPEASPEYHEELMHIHPPIDPLFRVGQVGLGYDADNDLVVLVTNELVVEEDVAEDTEATEKAGVVRFWCTRSQLRAMSHWGMELASRGRPICPQCGEPMETQGHFCVKKNGGHRRL